MLPASVTASLMAVSIVPPSATLSDMACVMSSLVAKLPSSIAEETCSLTAFWMVSPEARSFVAWFMACVMLPSSLRASEIAVLATSSAVLPMVSEISVLTLLMAS